MDCAVGLFISVKHRRHTWIRSCRRTRLCRCSRIRRRRCSYIPIQNSYPRSCPRRSCSIRLCIFRCNHPRTMHHNIHHRYPNTHHNCLGIHRCILQYRCCCSSRCNSRSILQNRYRCKFRCRYSDIRSGIHRCNSRCRIRCSWCRQNSIRCNKGRCMRHGIRFRTCSLQWLGQW